MLRDPSPKQHALEMVTIEELVPADHLLRKIARHIDFEFIRPATQHLYCADNGRPAVDPVTLFKILFIGYLFGVRSERQLMREIQVNTAGFWISVSPTRCLMPQHSAKTGAADLLIAILNKSSLMASSSKP